MYLWLLVLLSSGCTGRATVEGVATPSQSAGSDLELTIHHPSGERIFVDNMAEIQEVVRFDIVLPEDLPLDLQLGLASVQLPPDSVDELVKERHIRVPLGFENEGGTAGFQLIEGFVAPGIGPSGVRSIRQDDTIVNVTVNEEGEYVAATWEGCDIEFMLTGGPPDQLTEANLMNIVDSTLACRGVG